MHRWAARGRLHRVYRGVYVVGHMAVSERGTWAGAVLAAGAGACLCCSSAAHLWGIWRGRPERVVHVVSPRHHRAQRGVSFHRGAQLEGSDVDCVDGIPVTSVARTIVDLAEMLTPARLAAVMHEAHFVGLLDVADIRECLGRLAGRHRIAVAHAALVLHEAGSAGTRSRLEDRFLGIVGALDVPAPCINEHAKAAGRRYELDFWWKDEGLCVEIDGPGHLRPRTRRADAQRDAVLTGAGIRVLRFTAEDLQLRRRVVEHRLQTELLRDGHG